MTEDTASATPRGFGESFRDESRGGRHSGSDGRDWSASGGDISRCDAAREPDTGAGRLIPVRRLDPGQPAAPFKTYPDVVMHPLPRELRQSSLSAAAVLSGVRAAPETLDDDLLGTLLFLSAGVTWVAYSGDRPLWYRPTMSAGNLHPLEIYVVHDGQVLHYHPLEHALVPLRSGTDMGDGTTLVVTGIPFRTCWKYGERGWRHLWWDAGTMLANLLT